MRRAGYSLIVANSDDSRESEQALLRRLTSRGVDGVLLIPARESCAAGAGAALREDVERVTCPVVLIDRLTQCGWCDAVGFDNYLGGRLAAQYLLEGGHKRIGIVTGDVAESSAADRRRGFVDAIEQAGSGSIPRCACPATIVSPAVTARPTGSSTAVPPRCSAATT